jgi:hypothetical protein
VTLWPRDGVVMIPAKTWGGAPMILFSADSQGKYLLKIVAPGKDALLKAETVIQVGQGVQPPNPPDPPVPPTPGRRYVLVILESRTDRTLETAKLQAQVMSLGHNFGLVDKDAQAGNAQTSLGPWIDYVAEKKLAIPCLLILPLSDQPVKPLFGGPLAKTAAENIAILKKNGG